MKGDKRGTEHRLRVMGPLYKAVAGTRLGPPCTRKNKKVILFSPRPGPLDVTYTCSPPYCCNWFPHHPLRTSHHTYPSPVFARFSPVSTSSRYGRRAQGAHVLFSMKRSYPTCNLLVSGPPFFVQVWPSMGVAMYGADCIFRRCLVGW